MRHKALAIVSGALLPMLPITPAAAVVVTVGGNSYDVSFLNTAQAASAASFALPPLGEMPWWGNDMLASEFAFEVYDQLGPGWDPNYGPVFAYAIDGPANEVLGLTQSINNPLDQIDVTPLISATTAYAVVNTPVPVPGPLPLLGAVSAFGVSRRLRGRLRAVNR